VQTMTVADVMTTQVVSVTPAAAVKDIIDLLDVHGISAVPVLDPHGTLVGVVSEADLLRRQEHQDDDAAARAPLFAGHQTREQWRKAGGLTAADVMTSPALTVGATSSLPHAARLLAQADVRRLFVLHDGLMIGVVSRRDLLHNFLRADADIKADIDRDVLGRILKANMNMVRATVEHGVVMLTGQLEYEADVALAVRLCGSVPGVVRVTNRLDYIWNGQGTHREDPAESPASPVGRASPIRACRA
jgi:CBS domain-containing protein